MEIILASASARRHELLKRLVADFKIVVSNFDEDSIEFKNDFGSYVIELAKGKAKGVINTIKNEGIIIACDTIVASEGRVLGKPKDRKDAFEMLDSLSGKTHQVYSGIVLMQVPSGKILSDFVCTDVVFSELSQEQITEYIDSEEPMDKAGAYGIQGAGGIFVEKINGCYYNVVGLPLNRLYFMLREMGVNL